MKKYILLTLICLFTFNLSFGQSNFSRGFDSGYKNGYCQDQVSCIPPISPNPPNPDISESVYSYQDGYNRGFQMGLNAKKSDTSSTNRKGYTTSSQTFVDYSQANSYNPYSNLENVKAIANALKESKGVALEHLKNENYQAVANICFAGLKISPKDSEFMLLLGESYFQTGDSANALKWLKKSYSYRRNDAFLKERIQEIESGELPSEKQTVNTKSQSNSKSVNNDVINYGQRGIENYNQKKYSEAISDITKSAKNSNEIDPQLLVYRGLAKSELGDNYGAIADLDIIISNYSSTYWNMASVYNNKAYSLILLEKPVKLTTTFQCKLTTSSGAN